MIEPSGGVSAAGIVNRTLLPPPSRSVAADPRTIPVDRRTGPDRPPTRDSAQPDAGDLDSVADALSAARSGDQTGFELLYRDTHPRLLRYAASLIGADAEDVTSEAWLQIARDVRRFVGDLDAFRAWSARIVRNRAIDHARMRARRPADPLDEQHLAGWTTGADAYADAHEAFSTRAALAAIRSLPPDQAEAVLLRVVVGLDAGHAGQVLGKSAGAVRVAAHRGLKALAKRFAEPDIDRRA